MASNQVPDDEGERCVSASEAVASVALEECQSRGAIAELVGHYIGVDVDEVDVEADAAPITEDICESRRETREWVLRRAVDLVMDEEMAPVYAVRQAWDDATDGCGDHGVEI